MKKPETRTPSLTSSPRFWLAANSMPRPTTYYIRYYVEGKHLEEAVPEVSEDVDSCVTDREAVLVAHVPHSEQGCGSGGDQDNDEYSLEVNRIAHM